MKRLSVVSVALLSFTALATACGGDDTGSGDASADRTSPDMDAAGPPIDSTVPTDASDGGVDSTVVDASDSAVPDARDSALPDANGDANDGSTHDSAVPDANSDANDGAIADASDGAVSDGSSDATADAADANTPITCTPLPTVGSIYYSRQGLLADGGPKTDGEMWIVKGDGSSDTMIGNGEHPRLSPDGKHVLFFRDNVNYYAANIYVRDLATDGGAAVDHLVFTNNDAVGGFDWRPDSLGIVFDYKNDIYSADIDGSNMKKLITYRETDGYSDYPVVSRADGRIAFHNFYVGIVLADSTGANAAAVPNTYAGANYPQGTGLLPAADMFPAWSNDGTVIAFLRIPPVNEYVPGSMGTPYKIAPNGTGRTYLTPGLNPGDGFFGGGVISQDGAYYINAGIYLGIQDMYAVPLDGSGLIKRVCTTPGAPIDFVGSATN